MVLTRAYFQRFMRKDIFELPEVIRVHLKTTSGNNYDFNIKFIWEYGVGFSREDKKDHCTWCSVYNGTILTMPDGTDIVLRDDDTETFMREVFDWFKHRQLRLAMTDEVEFMDI